MSVDLLESEIRPEVLPEADTVLLDAASIFSAFEQLHKALSEGTISDAVTAANTARQDHLVGERTKLTSVANAVFSTLIVSNITSSPIPLLMTPAFSAAKHAVKHNRSIGATRKSWSDQTNGYFEANEALSDVLGGLSCLTWQDRVTKQLVIEVAEVDTEDQDAVLERLAYLQDIVRGSGMVNTLAGFILPKDLAAKIEGNANARPADEARIQLLQLDLKPTHEDSRVFVDSVGQNTAQKARGVQDIIRIIEGINRYHPLVIASQSGYDEQQLRVIARTSLQDRLQTILHQRDDDGTITGQKVALSPEVYDHMVVTYDASGRQVIIPASQLYYDPAKAHQLGNDYALRTLEFSVFKAAGHVPMAYHFESEITVAAIKKPNEISAAQITTDSVVLFGTDQKGDDDILQRLTLPKAEKKPARNLLRRSLATLALFGCLVHSESLNDDTVRDYIGIDTPVYDVELDVVRPIQRQIKQFELTIRNLLTEDKDSMTKDLEEALRQAYARGDSSKVSGDNFSDENFPLWFVHPYNGADPSGYWSLQRYDQLVPDENGSFAWQPMTQASRYEGIPSVDLISSTIPNLNKTINTIQDLHQQEPYTRVDGSAVLIRQDMFKDANGHYWQILPVPTQQSGIVTGAQVIYVGIESENTIINSPVEIRRVFNIGQGEALLIKLPDDFVPEADQTLNAYLEVSYIVETGKHTATYADLQLNNLLIPRTAGLNNTQTSNEIERSLVNGTLEYSINPLEGYDTNGDGRYTMQDVAEETISSGQANCFTANGLYATLHPESIRPVSGFYISAQAVDQDLLSSNGTSAVLASHDAHLFNVDPEGNIVDLTPTRGAEDDQEFFEHPKIEEGNSGFILSNISASQNIRIQKDKESNDRAGRTILLGLIGSLGVYGGALGLNGLLTRRRKKLLTNPSPKNLRAGSLALIAIYGLPENQSAETQLILNKNKPKYDNGDCRVAPKDANDRKTLPEPQQISVLPAKEVANKLKTERKKASVRYPYTMSDIKRAKRMVKAARKISQ